MKYDENGQPTLESVDDFQEFAAGFGPDADHDDIETAFDTGYELGLRVMRDQYGPVEEFLRTIAMTMFRLEFNTPVVSQVDEVGAELAESIMEIPGMRAFLANSIGYALRERFEYWNCRVFDNLTPDQQVALTLIYGDMFVHRN